MTASQDRQFEEFNYWLARASDTLTSVEGAVGNGLSARDKLILEKAMHRLLFITAEPVAYYTTYKDKGLFGVIEKFALDFGTGLIVRSVAVGVGSMIVGPAGVVLGVGMGVVAGVALDYGIGEFKKSSLFDIVLNSLTREFTSKDNELFFDDSTLLPTLVFTSYTRSKFDVAMENLQRTIDAANKSFGLKLTLDKLLEINNRSKAAAYYDSLARNDPTKLDRSRAIEDAIDEVIEAYQQNKAAIDAEDPSAAGIVGKLSGAIAAIWHASNFISPLVLDLDGDGINTLAIFSHDAAFDFKTDLPVAGHGWVGPRDGLLAQDANGNGLIDDITELFGGRDLDGFTMLERLDSNRDGVIDEHDEAYDNLVVWVDANSNGHSEAEELNSLEAHGIVSVGLKPTIDPRFDSGNFVPLTSQYTTASGETREIADIYFATMEAGGNTTAVSSPDSRVVLGSALSNVIVGSPKDQVLFGGAGADTFVFKQGFGKDTIVDFDTESGDVLEFGRGLFADFEAVLVAASQQGSDTVILFDEANSVTLQNVMLANFHADDVRFAA